MSINKKPNYESKEHISHGVNIDKHTFKALIKYRGETISEIEPKVDIPLEEIPDGENLINLFKARFIIDCIEEFSKGNKIYFLFLFKIFNENHNGPIDFNDKKYIFSVLMDSLECSIII